MGWFSRRCEQLGDVRLLRRCRCFRRKGALAEGGLEPGPLGVLRWRFVTSLHFQGLREKVSTHFILEAVAPACIPHHTGGGNRIRGVRPAEHVLLCLAEHQDQASVSAVCASVSTTLSLTRRQVLTLVITK